MTFNFRSHGTVNTHNITSLTKGFFLIKGNKATDITQEVLKQLELDGLRFNDCFTLGSDNAATMPSIQCGVQALIKNCNEKTLFNGFSSHCLNHCEEHSFAQNKLCITFF